MIPSPESMFKTFKHLTHSSGYRHMHTSITKEWSSFNFAILSQHLPTHLVHLGITVQPVQHIFHRYPLSRNRSHLMHPNFD